MTDIIANKLIGGKVVSKTYGEGEIKNVTTSGDNVLLHIRFSINGMDNVKQFSAQVVLERGSLAFEDEETLEILEQALNKSTSSTNTEKAIVNNSVISSASLSQNNAIARLVGKLVNNQSITIDLIDLFNDSAFEDEIYLVGFKNLEIIMRRGRISEIQSAQLLVALSLIALKYYDSDLHSKIESSYRKYCPDTQDRFSRNSITNAFYSVVNQYDLRKKVRYFDEKSYVAVPIILACVPHYRVKDLFWIAYDIYKKKLLFDEDVTDIQIYDKIFESLSALKRKDLIGDSDNIKGTEYLMSKYTQSCIYSGYNIRALVSIIACCIRAIINHLTRLEDSFTVSSFYAEGYEAWVTAFEANTSEKEKYAQTKSLSQPYFQLQDKTNIYLHTGKYCMDDSKNPGNVRIELFSNGSLASTLPLNGPNDIVFNDDKAMGGYIVERQTIAIPCSPVSSLSYKIVCGDTIVYDSKDRLYRNVLFFDGHGKEIKPGTEYNGALFAVTQTQVIEEDAYLVFEGNNYFISIVEVNSSNVFRFDNEPYVFYVIKDSQIIGYQVPWTEYITMEKKTFPIHKDISILFQASCNKEDIYLDIDDNLVTYGEESAVNYRIYLYSHEYGGLFAYMVKIYGLEPGFHRIMIYNSVSKKQIKNADFRVVYDDSIIREFIEKENTGIVYNLESAFISSSQIEYKYGQTQLLIDAFVKGLGHGKMNLLPSVISYSLDGSLWNSLDTKLILSDVSSQQNEIQISGPRGMNAYYVDDTTDSEARNQLNLKSTSNDYLYTLGLEYIKTRQGKKKAKVCFEFGTRKKYFFIWYHPKITGNDFHFDSDKLEHVLSVSFEGNSKLWLVAKPLNNDEVFLQREIASDDVITVSKDLFPAGCHYLSISVHAPKRGDLFHRYNSEPIFTLPKYCVDQVQVFINKEKTVCTYYENEKSVGFSVSFTGADTLLVKLIPSGFENIVWQGVIESCTETRVFVGDWIYSSYLVCLYKPSEANDNEYDETPFNNLKSVSVDSPILRKQLKVLCYLSTTNKTVSANENIQFSGSIETYNGIQYILSSIVSLWDGRPLIRNLLLRPIDFTSDSATFSIRHKDELGKLVHIQKDKETLERVIVKRNNKDVGNVYG